MRPFRTVLEQKIGERRQTLEEFAEYAETFAREHAEPGTLSVRHLQRLTAGRGPKGQPLGPVRPATARLLERIFGTSVDELLRPPSASVSANQGRSSQGRGTALISERPADIPGRRHDAGEDTASNLAACFEWLDERAGWIPDTSRRKVLSRLGRVTATGVRDQSVRRAKVRRSQLARGLAEYYADPVQGFAAYRATCEGSDVETSILTRPDWLDLACPLTPDAEQLTLVDTASSGATLADLDTRHAVQRLAEAAALDVRVANAQLYRLLSIDATKGAIDGTVGLVPFAEYALTADLLENELIDAIADGASIRRGALPLREKYLPDLPSVVNVSGRLCVGGVLALCAIARPSDPYRGPADYALLVQERSGHVLNAARRLSVIPKGFHQPLADIRADARVAATLRREMEEELFGRGEVDSTSGERRAAAPMHPGRLSEPMRWLMNRLDRIRMECTGFGLNLVSGNYEFASLIVIDDEEFWTHYGGEIEANWEASGLRLYSSLDRELISGLIFDESWGDEGVFALLQGIRRLEEFDESRIDLPAIDVA